MSAEMTSDHKVLRVFYSILFYFIYGLSELVLLVIAVIQTLLNLFGNGPSDTLRGFGASFGLYIKQLVDYLSYNQDQKPFPFSDWPDSERKAD